ncbi:MAG: CTP synthase [Promethearchaeota archaeon]
MTMKLSIIGDFNPNSETHASTNMAIMHSKNLLQCDLDSYWIDTQDITEKIFSRFDGFLIAPGSPYNSMENVIDVIQYARENNKPCLGMCGGFQHMIIEYARNVLGFKNAQHEEYNQNSLELFITKLLCSLKGRNMEINLVPGSKVASLYGKNQVIEKYYCNYGVNHDYIQVLKNGPFNIVGSDREGGIRVFEHPDHTFFIGTLYVPQVQSTYNAPYPLMTGFIDAIINSSIK